MRILFLGDVVGKAGRDGVLTHLPEIQKRLFPDAVLVNGENAAGGFGITEAIFDRFLKAGVTCVTLGNHAFDQRESLRFMDHTDRLVRPMNYPKDAPGRGSTLLELANGKRLLVMNVLGTTKMNPLDDPFQAVDLALDACPLGQECDASVLDVHAELTSEKMAIGHFCDGRTSLVVGTHTHVPTADHRILRGGTAYLTDCGMCGDYDSVIGMDKDEPLNRFLSKIPKGRFTPACGPATICGVFVTTDPRTGKATSISPLRVGGDLEEVWPCETGG